MTMTGKERAMASAAVRARSALCSSSSSDFFGSRESGAVVFTVSVNADRRPVN
jgi:hypothetical protein